MTVTPGLERPPATVARDLGAFASRSPVPAAAPLGASADYASEADRSPENVVAIQSIGEDFSTLVNAAPFSLGPARAALGLYRQVQSGSHAAAALLDVHA